MASGLRIEPSEVSRFGGRKGGGSVIAGPWLIYCKIFADKPIIRREAVEKARAFI
jgi:hypothetical protein